MKLATVASVQHLIAFDSGLQSIEDAIDTALEEATAFLRTELRTPFDRVASVTDLFFVEKTLKVGTDWRTRLALSRGFIQSGTVTYLKATSYADLLDGVTEDVAEFATINRDLGTVNFHGVEFVNRFIQITTPAAGFEVSAGDTSLYKQDQVPDWLKAAARLQAVVSLDATNPTLRHEQAQPRLVEDMMRRVANLIAPHKRYLPQYMSPVDD
jgi:hypothetical protein